MVILLMRLRGVYTGDLYGVYTGDTDPGDTSSYNFTSYRSRDTCAGATRGNIDAPSLLPVLCWW